MCQALLRSRWVLVASLVGNVCSTTLLVEKLEEEARLDRRSSLSVAAVQMVASPTISILMVLQTTQVSLVAAGHTKTAISAMPVTPELVALHLKVAMVLATAVVVAAAQMQLALTVWMAQLAA
jgi:hypothetical protein